jgi:CheY-like chemotaxis protein
VELRDVIDAALDSVMPAADAKNIRIDREFDEIEPITGDKDRLQQIAWNLLSNAVKFTPRDGRVTVTLRRTADDVVLVVRDTGIGISREFLPCVFDRFSQADSSATRRHGGLGLGMAIVRHLVELHGGTVRAESDGEDRGATFTATLPIRMPAPPPHVSPSVERALYEQGATEGLPQLDGVNVLVVDDEADSRSFLCTLLERQGARVQAAGSTPEALDAFSRERPDVLVSDIGMPGEDGYALIQRVRAMAEGDGGRTPAVALTAYVRAQDEIAALRAGYHRHIRKPVVVAELISTVAELAAAGQAQ